MGDRRRREVLALVLCVALLAGLAGAAAAAVEFGSKPNSWDDIKGRYENGNVTMWLNKDLQPMYSGVYFTTPAVQTLCQSPTIGSGQAEVGLGYVDPGGTKNGFQSTQDWALYKCSDLGVTKYPVASPLAICTLPNQYDPSVYRPCQLISKDVETTCSDSSCGTQLVTQFVLNVDANCDGAVDSQFAPEGGLCIYWNAVKPPFSPPFWGPDTLKVNVVDPSGTKTTNFSMRGPNAVGLSTFAGSPVGAPWAVALGVGAVLIAGVGVARRRGRAETKENKMTEMPSSTEPGAYEPPAVVYEGALEVRAGSPLKLPDPLDLPE